MPINEAKRRAFLDLWDKAMELFSQEKYLEGLKIASFSYDLGENTQRGESPVEGLRWAGSILNAAEISCKSSTYFRLDDEVKTAFIASHKEEMVAIREWWKTMHKEKDCD